MTRLLLHRLQSSTRSAIRRAVFAAHGDVIDRDCLWLRKQCMMLARNCHPVDYWLSMTLAELQVWIDANNGLFDKDNAKQ